MGHSLELKRLKALGCDLAQGYVFSPPVPAEGIAEGVERVRRLVEVSPGRGQVR